MKIVKTTEAGETRELLLKEYFLNAYLVGVLKRLGAEVGRLAKEPPTELEPSPVKVRS